jgi:1-acyl-sn-glycerol-3-phosphate acyltransferase
VPLVPIAIVGTYELLPMHTRQFFPQKVKLVVGEPIDTAAYSSRQVEELTERLKKQIGRLYYAHSHLVAGQTMASEDPLTSEEKTLAT